MILNFKSAISPVVATALLLVVAVVSVVGFSGWFNEFSSSVFVDVESDVSSSNNLDVEGIFNDILYLKSSSNSDLSLFSVRDSSGSEVCFFDSSVELNNSGLLAYWKFDDNEGIIKDYSGNGNHGTLFGDTLLLMDLNNNDYSDKTGYNHTIIDTNSVDCSVSGISDEGCAFDSSINKILSIGDSSNFNLTNESVVTFSVWFNYTGSTYYQASIFGKTDTYWYNTPGYFLWTDDGGRLLFMIWNDDNTYNITISTPSNTIPLNEWNHAVVIFNKGNVKLYGNGILYNDENLSFNNFQSNVPLQLGQGGWGKRFNGTIDEFVVYDKALDPDEINKLYESQKANFIEFEESSLDKAVRFDGIDDMFNFSEINLNFDNGSSIYVKITPELNPKGSFMTLFEHYSVTYYKYLFLHLENQYLGIESNTNNDHCTFKSNYPLTNNEIYFAMNIDAYNCSGYTGGKELNIGSNPLVNDLSISGINVHSSTTGFKGLVDEIRIYNRTLSKIESSNLDWRFLKTRTEGMGKVDLSFCNLDKNNQYQIVGIYGTQKIDVSVISK